MPKVKNPLTGRMIDDSGALYKKLVKAGTITASAAATVDAGPKFVAPAKSSSSAKDAGPAKKTPPVKVKKTKVEGRAAEIKRREKYRVKDLKIPRWDSLSMDQKEKEVDIIKKIFGITRKEGAVTGSPQTHFTFNTGSRDGLGPGWTPTEFSSPGRPAFNTRELEVAGRWRRNVWDKGRTDLPPPLYKMPGYDKEIIELYNPSSASKSGSPAPKSRSPQAARGPPRGY